MSTEQFVEGVTPSALHAPEPPTDRLTTPGQAGPREPAATWQTERTTERPLVRDTTPTELRVHGVSGSPAEDVLDRPLIGQVAGDGEAGFFRPRTEYGATLGPGGARLEAYRWGNLTSGAAARAFWLLLLPFTLANVSMWLRPPAVGMGRRITHGLVRLFALTMSATLVIASIGIFVDLIGWQCAAPTATCSQQRPWLRFFFSGFFEPTGRRLAVAAIGPILVVVGLWFLAVRSWAKYESYELPERNADGDGLATPTFWDGRDQVGRLRSVHIAAMFATIDAMMLFVLVRHDLDTDAYYKVDLRGIDSDLVVQAGSGLAGVVAAILLLSILLLLIPPMVERVSKSPTAAVVGRLLRWLSLLATAATLGYAMLPRAPWPTNGPLPGYAGTVTKLFSVQVVILALMTLVCLFLRHRCKGAFLAGFGMPVVASLSLGLGAAMSAGVEFRVAGFLGGNQLTSATDVAPIDQLSLEPPRQYQWAAIGFVLLVLLAIGSVLWVRVVTAPTLRRRARRETDEDYPGRRAHDRGRAAQIDDAIADARLTEHLSRVLGVAWFIVAGAGVVATAFALRGKGPVDLISNNQGLRDTVS